MQKRNAFDNAFFFSDILDRYFTIAICLRGNESKFKTGATLMPTARITTKWQDTEGRQTTVPLYFDSGDVSTVALAQTAFSTYETLLHAMSGNAIIDAEVCFALTPALTESPDAGYNVRSGAYASFENSDTIADGIYIPGVLESKMIAGILDFVDSDVAAFIAEAISGTIPLSSRGSASKFALFRRGFETVRKLSR